MSLARMGALVGLMIASAGACADALRLEPPGDVVPGSGGGGGGAPTPCNSSSDCAYPTPVCDQVRQECVECLSVTDCALQPGTVCSGHTCTCPNEGEIWCEQAGGCVDATTSSEHCGVCNHRCFGLCADGACTDPWEPVTSADAPAARAEHVAVWTGSAMIVWGGQGGSSALGDGGIYDPATFEWTPTSPVGAPSPRLEATAVWTGDRMIVWGGRNGSTYYNDGALFDPATHTWTAMSTSSAPSARARHSAVWTGSEMIVWGGNDDNDDLATGGRYDPAADSWVPIAQPTVPRRYHAAVWTGSEMWIHGGIGDVGVDPDLYLPASGEPGGQAYDLSGDTWNPLNAVGEPSARAYHTAVWSGVSMLVFGGYDGTSHLGNGFALAPGGMWAAFAGSGPAARRDHSAVFVEDPGVMVVFGGRGDASAAFADGGVYDPNGNMWTQLVPNAIEGRYGHSAVSTGDRMIVWGGFNAGGSPLQSGGVYNPSM